MRLAPAHPNDDHNLFIEGFGPGNMHIFFFGGGKFSMGCQFSIGLEERRRKKSPEISS